MARYTSARIGGPADFFFAAASTEALAQAAQAGWEAGIPLRILGGGSNVLVSDLGFRGLVILNQTHGTHFDERSDRVQVRADSGVGLGTLARQCVARGYAGLEWGASVPGTVGGAVVGNAGAHGGDIAGVLEMADILQPEGVVQHWAASELGYGYRTSRLKAGRTGDVVLAVDFALDRASPSDLQARVDGFLVQRKRTQPGGASIGSMFKNPLDDHAGRLIETAGLKGRRIGNAHISPLHANFFVNLGGARAQDVKALMDLAQAEVHRQFGVALETEIELAGEW